MLRRRACYDATGTIFLVRKPPFLYYCFMFEPEAANPSGPTANKVEGSRTWRAVGKVPSLNMDPCDLNKTPQKKPCRDV